jgi:hypothetical protein
VPSARALAAALLTGTGVALYFALWFRWPTFLAIGAGATLAVVMLLFAASLGDDPEEADAAWRAAAPDLAARERGASLEPDLSEGPGPAARLPATPPRGDGRA